MPTIKKHRSHGFTLIELSIVLVIIGLIVGGVLVGQDLIKVSKARSLMGQMQELQLAVTTFKLKYNCVPGDCKQATNFGLGSSGNGDKILTGLGNRNLYNNSQPIYTTPIHDPSADIRNASPERELQWFWAHLSEAGFIKAGVVTMSSLPGSSGIDALKVYFPFDAMNTALLNAFSWGGRLYIRTGFSQTLVGNVYGGNAFTLDSAQMYYIEEKIGSNLTIGANSYESMWVPNQKVTPIGSTGHPVTLNYATQGAAGSECAVSDGGSGYKYNIENNGKCNLMYRID